MPMANSKKHLDADDLLKRLEEPVRKRRKLSPTFADDDLYDSDLEVLEGNFLGLKGGDDDDTNTDDESLNGNADSKNSESEDDDRHISSRVQRQNDSSQQQSLLDNFNSLSPRISLRSKQKISAGEVPVSMKKEHTTSDFSSLGLSRQLVAALSSMSITTPTEVQISCIPPLLEGMCQTKR